MSEFKESYAEPDPPGYDAEDGIISSTRFDPGSYTVDSSLTVTAGTVWTIDGTLTVNATINNYGTIIMTALDNNGIINNIDSGTLIID